MSTQTSPQTVDSRLRLNSLLIYLKGIAMGMGDSVPGISGGTIAVITGIYDKLIFSIRAVDLNACRLLLRGKLLECWQHINGNFLLLLALGILTGLLLSANTVLYFLANYFQALMAFFIGLVLASSWLLKRECNFRLWRNLLALLLGASVTILVGLMPPLAGNFSLLSIFVCGAVAICAMILPGLSGAFILLLLGVYEFLLTALIEFNFPIILVFMLGCVVGLLSFSRLLAWLLRTHHQLSYGFIIGMLLGSLSVLWPWQQTRSSYIDSSGLEHVLQARNLWPSRYLDLTGQEPMSGVVALCLLLGMVIVAGLHFAATNLQNESGVS